MSDKVNALPSVKKVNAQEIARIKANSVLPLPNRVINQAEELKKRMVEIVTSDTKGVISVINRIVDEINELQQELVKYINSVSPYTNVYIDDRNRLVAHIGHPDSIEHSVTTDAYYTSNYQAVNRIENHYQAPVIVENFGYNDEVLTSLIINNNGDVKSTAFDFTDKLEIREDVDGVIFKHLDNETSLRNGVLSINKSNEVSINGMIVDSNGIAKDKEGIELANINIIGEDSKGIFINVRKEEE